MLLNSGSGGELDRIGSTNSRGQSAVQKSITRSGVLSTVHGIRMRFGAFFYGVLPSVLKVDADSVTASSQIRSREIRLVSNFHDLYVPRTATACAQRAALLLLRILFMKRLRATAMPINIIRTLRSVPICDDVATPRNPVASYAPWTTAGTNRFPPER